MSRFRWSLIVAVVALGSVSLLACGSQAAEGDAGVPEAVRLASNSDGKGLTIKVVKSPTCGCCAKWIEHLEEAGFEVEVEDSYDMAQVKAQAGVPAAVQSCHTAMIGDYVFEGHVPVETIVRFMKERPDVKGLAVPGMPVGSQGMEMGGRVDPYDVIAFDGSTTSIYESRR